MGNSFWNQQWYFTIEKSHDGLNYDEIGNIEGNGTTNNTFNYSFIDRETSVGAYYRLKQTDFEGVFKYEGFLFQDYLDQQENEITFYPNPKLKHEICDYF